MRRQKEKGISEGKGRGEEGKGGEEEGRDTLHLIFVTPSLMK
jgi:hypothetical protein